jgi:hypothetical protein
VPIPAKVGAFPRSAPVRTRKLLLYVGFRVLLNLTYLFSPSEIHVTYFLALLIYIFLYFGGMRWRKLSINTSCCVIIINTMSCFNFVSHKILI